MLELRAVLVGLAVVALVAQAVLDQMAQQAQ
jgi:hypothetical protein